MWRVNFLLLIILYHNPDAYHDREDLTLYEYGPVEESGIRADFDSPLISVWNGDGIQIQERYEEIMEQNVRILQRKGLLRGIFMDYH